MRAKLTMRSSASIVAAIIRIPGEQASNCRKERLKHVRLLKKAVQRGRNGRKGEAYFYLYVEPLSDVRTMLAAFFSSLFKRSRRVGPRADQSSP